MKPENEIALSIVMPAYNEEENVEKTVAECMEFLEREGIAGEVIVANDGSTDGTLAVLKRLEGRFGNFRCIDLEQNLGYGGAMKKAIDSSRGEMVVTIDSDGQFDINDVPRLRDKIREGFDCVTGFRIGKKDTLPRVFANWGYNLLVTALCGVRFSDAQCALKIYNGDIIRALPVEAKGFTFPTETLVRLHDQGCRIAEEPVTHRFREAGQSKLKFFKTARSMFAFLVYLRLKLAMQKAGNI